MSTSFTARIILELILGSESRIKFGIVLYFRNWLAGQSQAMDRHLIRAPHAMIYSCFALLCSSASGISSRAWYFMFLLRVTTKERTTPFLEGVGSVYGGGSEPVDLCTLLCY